jgi:hypothetical protein
LESPREVRVWEREETEVNVWGKREETILAAIGEGSDRHDIVQNCVAYGISSAAVDRRLKRLLELGTIQRLSTGFYIQAPGN